MPLKDTPDGQTHYYGDGCVPPHKDPNEVDVSIIWRVLRMSVIIAALFYAFAIVAKFLELMGVVSAVMGVTVAATFSMFFLLGIGTFFSFMYSLLYPKK